ncbi:MAG: regulatory protein RecX [Pseudomonadales bacterium]
METTDPVSTDLASKQRASTKKAAKEISEATFKNASKPSEKDLRRAGIDMLARREHSCVEMRRKLARKFEDNFTESQIDEVIETLSAEGLQSDLRFAESFTRSKYERGDGPYKIKAALQDRGVHAGLIERVLDDEQLDWQRRAKLLYQRKFPHYDGARERSNDYSEEVLKQRAKEMRFLQSRGFPKDMIYSVVN